MCLRLPVVVVVVVVVVSRSFKNYVERQSENSGFSLSLTFVRRPPDRTGSPDPEASEGLPQAVLDFE